jgi:hypothetical protein
MLHDCSRQKMVSQQEKDERETLERKEQQGTITDAERSRLNELKNK